IVMTPPAPAAGQSQPAPPEAEVARLLDRMVGTWEMNLAKSQDFVGPPAFKSVTIVCQRAPEKLAVLCTKRGTRADGTEFSNKGLEAQFFDGKDYALSATASVTGPRSSAADTLIVQASREGTGDSYEGC